jgi:hypothetical protein
MPFLNDLLVFSDGPPMSPPAAIGDVSTGEYRQSKNN